MRVDVFICKQNHSKSAADVAILATQHCDDSISVCHFRCSFHPAFLIPRWVTAFSYQSENPRKGYILPAKKGNRKAWYLSSSNCAAFIFGFNYMACLKCSICIKQIGLINGQRGTSESAVFDAAEIIVPHLLWGNIKPFFFNAKLLLNCLYSGNHFSVFPALCHYSLVQCSTLLVIMKC